MDNSKYVFEMKENVPVRTSDAKSLHEMNTNELRDLAVSLGADKNKLYGTSKQALIIIIDKLKREKSNDMKTVDESKAYSVGYKSNGVYQSIAVIANSEEEAVRKAKEHFAKRGKEAEVFGASIGESIETIKRKGKPIIDSKFVLDNVIRSCDEVVTVNESDFVSSHAKNPKGYGHWIFGIGSKNMSDWFETTGTYAESKKRAIEEAKKKSKTTVYTMG